MTTRWGESGNIFFTLFGAIALVGVVGAATSTLMRGPVGTVVSLNQRAKADSQMQIAMKLAILEAQQRDTGLGDPAPDCDNDALIEPMHPGPALPGLNGGGQLPSVGSTSNDPWGVAYGYCGWDHGTMNGVPANEIGSGCADGAPGQPLLDGVPGAGGVVLAVISAGPDRQFGTTCVNAPAPNTPYITRGVNGADDIITEMTYAEANEASGGLWYLKSGNPDEITTGKALDVQQGAQFTSGNVGFTGANTSVSFDAGVPLDLSDGGLFMLPTELEASVTCSGPADRGILRRNTNNGAPGIEILEICDGAAWLAIGGGGAAVAAVGDDSWIQFNVGGVAGIGGVMGANANLRYSSGGGIVATGASTLGSVNVTSAASVTGATSLGSTLNVAGNATLGGTVDITGAATMDSTLQVTGDATFDGEVYATDGTSAVPAYSFTSDIDTGLYYSSGGLRFSIGGTDQFAISSGGITATNATITNDLTVGNNLTTQNLTVNDVIYADRFISDMSTASAALPAFQTEPGTGIFSPVDNSLALVAGGLSRVTIDGAGDVGIGVSNPEAMLDIGGEVKIGTSMAACGVTLHGAIRYVSGDVLQVCSSITNIWETIGTSGGGGGGASDYWKRISVADKRLYYTENFVGVGTNDPLTTFHVNGDFLNTGTFAGPATVPVTGAGTRMFFDPESASFRAGQVTNANWDNTQIGIYSVAMGYNTRANGTGSFAVGSTAQAVQNYSIAMGRDVYVNGVNSAGLGLGTAAGTAPAITGTSSFGIFMGDQSGVGLAANNTMALLGGRFIIDQTPAVAPAVSGALSLDVEGGVGAVQYCDENGTYCFTAQSIATGTSAAPGTNREIIFNSGGVLGTSSLFVFSSAGNLELGGTGAIKVPVGTSANRPGTPANGMLRYNSTTGKFEGYQGGNWYDIITTGGGGIAINDLSDAITNYTSGNMYLGVGSGDDTTTGQLNTSLGSDAMAVITTGYNNVAVGANSLKATLGGRQNVAVGFNALTANINGDFNTAVGSDTLIANLSGIANTALGQAALIANTTGAQNTGLGTRALQANTSGSNNVAIGNNALYSNISSNASVAIGHSALNSSTGEGNTALGHIAGSNITSGTYNIMLGYGVQAANASGNYQLNIGNLLTGTTNAGLLTINGTGALTLPIGQNANRPTGVNGMIRYNSTTNKFEGYQGGGWYDIITSAVAGGAAAPDRGIQFNSGGNFAANANFVFSSIGNVGIGTVNPSAKLTVLGDLLVGDIGSASGRPVTINSSNGIIETRGDTGGWAFGYHARGSSGTDRGGFGFLGGADVLNFYYIGDSYLNPTMVVTPAGGRLGLGTTSPQAKLDVSGTDAILFPRGQISNRPASPVNGMMRYNSVSNKFEGYQGGGWYDIITSAVAGGAAAPDRGIQFNSGGNFAADANFIYSSQGTFSISGTYSGTNTAPLQGAGTRMFFDPAKAAFRAGGINAGQWDYASTGNYSAAFGRNTTASGGDAFVTGANSTASGGQSTALGFTTTASGSQSMAMGANTIASNTASTAMGWGTTSSGHSSTAMGIGTVASGSHALATGFGTIASGQAAMTFGKLVVAGNGIAGSGLGNGSVAFGLIDAPVTITTASQVRGIQSYGIFMGDQDGLVMTANNTMGLFGGQLVIDPRVPAQQLSARGVLDLGAATDAIVLPIGQISNRPASPVNGMMRYNSVSNKFEGYQGGGWYDIITSAVAGGAAAPDRGIQFNSGGNFAADANFTYTSAGNVGINTSSPQAKLQVAGDFITSGTFTGTPSIGVSGSGSRMFFDVETGALRAGVIGGGTTSQWDNINLGHYSGAIGYSTVASGVASFAVGYAPSAIADYSIALGHRVDTTGQNSASFGLGVVTGASAFRPNTSGTSSLGVYMGDQTGVTFAANNTMGLFGGKMVIDPRVPAQQLTARGVIDVGAATDAIVMPYGGTSQRPVAPVNGMLRYNSNTNKFEGYQGGVWNDILTTGGGAIAINDLSDAITDYTSGSMYLGQGNGDNITTGYDNTALGDQALAVVTSGNQNTAIGKQALDSNLSGIRNTAIGSYAAQSISTGGYNVAIGNFALQASNGSFNTAIGDNVLISQTSGSGNTVIGRNAMNTATAGSYNTVIGESAGLTLSTGGGNIIIGRAINVPNPAGNYQLNIGDIITGDMSAGLLAINGTGALTLPVGQTATRPASPVNGMLRYNSVSGKFEGYQGGVWNDILTSAVSGGAAAPDRGIQFNSGGSFAADSRFIYSSQGVLSVSGTYTGTSNAPVTGPGSRMFYDPGKAAFRVGAATGVNWDSASIGNYSMGVGFDTVASGTGSAALGYSLTTTAPYSLALGRQVDVTGTYSGAIGLGSTAGTRPAVGGQSSLGIFMGDQSGVYIAANNTMAVMGGRLVIDPRIPASQFAARSVLDLGAATDAIVMPSGGTAQRPASPVNGMMRYNSNNNKFEAYVAGVWQDLLSSSVGAIALDDLTDAVTSYTSNNMFLGQGVGATSTISSHNTALGAFSFQSVTSGSQNTAMGRLALTSLTTGGANTAIGVRALRYNVSGTANTAVGQLALENTTGGYNTGMGHQALFANTSGQYNTALGVSTLALNTIGVGNVAVGHQAYGSLTSGDNNTALGYFAGYNMTGGTNNIMIGNATAAANPTGSNQLNIGNVITGDMFAGLIAINGTGALTLPIGQVSNRPAGVNGMLRYNSVSNKFEGYQSGSWQDLVTGTVTTTFLALSDTPASYAGEGGKYLRVNAGTTAIEFTDEIVASVAGQPAPADTILDDLGDVVITAPASTQVLTYNGTNWVNTAASAGTPGTPDRGIQFNSGGAFTADANFTYTSIGRVGINTATPRAMLEVGGTDAILFPRGTSLNRPATPINGMARYNTSTGKIEMYANGWFDLLNTAGGVLAIDDLTDAITNYTSNSMYLGANSGTAVTTAVRNTALGQYAMSTNVASNRGTAIGYQAMRYTNDSASLTTSYNTAVGEQALRGSVTPSANTGIHNVAVGNETLRDNSTGSFNTAIGTLTVRLNTTGGGNTGVGHQALAQTTVGNSNAGFGVNTMVSNVAGSEGVAIGNNAMEFSNNSATPFVTYNTAVGFAALRGSGTPAANTGIYNTALGHGALVNVTSGNNNLGIGASVGSNITTGSNNIVIGGTLASGTADYQLNLGNLITGTTNTGLMQINGTGALTLPIGQTGNRPSPVNGMIRYNSQTNKFEGYQNSAWVDIIATAGAVAIDDLTDAIATYGATNSLYFGSGVGNLATGLGNTVVGASAMTSASTGNYNSVFGSEAMQSLTTGVQNTAIGIRALRLNQTGTNNVAVGQAAMNTNVAGVDNVAVGVWAMRYANDATTTTYNANTAVGTYALQGSTTPANNTGNQNTAIGYVALQLNSSGSNNIAVGAASLKANTTGGSNTGIGVSALEANTTGNTNTALGFITMSANTIGGANTAVGGGSLVTNVGGSEATAVGYEAMRYANSATGAFTTYNTALGTRALYGSVTAASNTGIANTAIGHSALANVTSGNNNVSLGDRASDNITTGSNNITIGSNIDVLSGTGSYQLNIGNVITGDMATGTLAINGTGALTVPVGQTGNRPTGVNGMIRYNSQTNKFEAYQASAWVDMIGGSGGTPASPDRGIQFNSGGAFAANSNFVYSSQGVLSVAGTYSGTNTAPVTGAGTRMYFDPAKSAFRVGTVTGAQWNYASTGNYSTAMGYNVIASNDYSVAMGESTTASGLSSVAMGRITTASGSRSTAMGNLTISSGTSSTAMGSTTVASGSSSTSMGFMTGAYGDGSTSMGINTIASGYASTAMGRHVTAGNGIGYSDFGDGSMAIGLIDDIVTITTPSQVRGIQSYGIFMGDQDGLVMTANNTMGLFGGTMVIDPRVPASQLAARGVLDLGAGTDALVLPLGATGQRPGSPVNGMIRYNSTTNKFEGYQAGAWVDMIGGSGGSSSFLALTDTPSSYAGEGGKYLRVNAGTTAVEFTDEIVTTVSGAPAPAVPNIDDLGDVVITTPTSTQVLTYNGTNWVNAAASAGALAIDNLTDAITNYTSATMFLGNGGALITTGTANTALGSNALLAVTTGTGNTVLGANSMRVNQVGNYNIAMGQGTMRYAVGISQNTAIGHAAMFNAYDGAAETPTYNVAIGMTALNGSATPANNLNDSNVAVGHASMAGVTTGSSNVAVGRATLANITAGGYNVAVGRDAMLATTVGNTNVAVGASTMTTNVGGSQNVAVGPQAMAYANSVAATTDTFNTAVGGYALRGSMTAAANTGMSNTALGFSAMYNNTTGSNNIAVGVNSMILNTTGQYNAAMGRYAMGDNTIGSYNVGIGASALLKNRGGDGSVAVGVDAMANANSNPAYFVTYNTAVGSHAMQGSGTPASNTGVNGTAVGYNALFSLTSGNYSTAIGALTLSANTTGEQNTALGAQAMQSNTIGNYNTALGVNALFTGTGSSNNVALGHSTLFLTTGNNNTAVGMQAGDNITTGSSNIMIGSGVDASSAGVSSELNIGNTIYGDLSTDRIGIGAAPAAGVELYVTGDIQYTGTITDVSDRRLKNNIHPLSDRGSMLDKIASLDAYSFTMKDDKDGNVEFGVMAQDIKKIFPELVRTDASTPENYMSVNYVGMIAPMIEATRELKAENDALKAKLSTLEQRMASIEGDMNGMKAHTGYGISKAQMGLGMIVGMMLTALCAGAVLLVTRRRKA